MFVDSPNPGILVGCHGPGSYSWSDDWGQTWNRLAGVPNRGPEVYQSWIHALPDGHIVCAGHYGLDAPIGAGRRHENYAHLHTFRLKVNRRTKNTKISVERDFNETGRRWLNRFTISLTQDGRTPPDKQLEFWYVERYIPGYDSWNAAPLPERIQAGGTLVKPKTDASGKTRVKLPERFDKITKRHLSYQRVVRYNMDRSDPDYKPFQTPQLEFYANAVVPAKLKAKGN